MGERYMRMLLFFDLPMETYEDRREYSRFRKFLISDGFIMVQKSVYSKLALNGTVSEAQRGRLLKNKPAHGLVQLLIITEKQYASMEFLLGEAVYGQIDDTERLVII